MAFVQSIDTSFILSGSEFLKPLKKEAGVLILLVLSIQKTEVKESGKFIPKILFNKYGRDLKSTLRSDRTSLLYRPTQ